MTAEQLSDMLENKKNWKSDMIQSPSTAVLLYYLNSGMFRFGQHKQFEAGPSGSSPSVAAAAAPESHGTQHGSPQSQVAGGSGRAHSGLDDSHTTESHNPRQGSPQSQVARGAGRAHSGMPESHTAESFATVDDCLEAATGPSLSRERMTCTEKDKLMKEIRDEALSEEEAKKLIETWFTRHSFTEGDLISCGACGL